METWLNCAVCAAACVHLENAWSFLRSRLDATHPEGSTIEGRAAFLSRLRAAVAWVNKHHRAGLLPLSFNQKERATDVKANDGHRTDW